MKKILLILTMLSATISYANQTTMFKDYIVQEQVVEKYNAKLLKYAEKELGQENDTVQKLAYIYGDNKILTDNQKQEVYTLLQGIINHSKDKKLILHAYDKTIELSEIIISEETIKNDMYSADIIEQEQQVLKNFKERKEIVKDFYNNI